MRHLMGAITEFREIYAQPFFQPSLQQLAVRQMRIIELFDQCGKRPSGPGLHQHI